MEDKLAILKEIGHVLGICQKDADRDRLVEELWKRYETTPPVYRMEVVKVDELTKPTKKGWIW